MKKTIVIAILLTFISSVTRADDTNLSKISNEAGIASICYNGVFKEDRIEGWLAEDGLIPFAKHLSTIEVMLGFEDLTGWYQNNWIPTLTALNESYKLGELYSQKVRNENMKWHFLFFKFK